MKDIYPPKPTLQPGGTVLMKVEGLQVGNRVFDASLVRAGEIVGLAGMVGSGRTELEASGGLARCPRAARSKCAARAIRA